MKTVYRIVFAVLVLGLTACGNDKRSRVPSYPVQFDIDIVAEYPHFVPANGYQTLTFTKKRYMTDYIGYAGLLVWIDFNQQYQAADLCCPNCLDQHKPLRIDGIFAVCDSCGEKYDLSYGLAVPQKGICDQALRKYEVGIRGNHLLISN